MANPLIRKKERSKLIPTPNQSAGIFDDFAVRKNVATKQGTIEKVPVNDSDIVNKKYVDDETHWERTGTNVHLKTSTDNVGIGTTAPRLSLHVMDGQIATPQTPNSNCDMVIEGTGDTGIQFLSDTQTQLRFGSSGGTGDGSIIFTHSDNMLTFNTDSGKFYFNGGNVGIGTASPDTKLQVVGDFKSGDDNTNYLSLATDGELSLTGTARVTRHLRVGAGNWKPGAAAPTAAFDGVFCTLDFDNVADDEVYYTLIVPSRWDSSVDIEFVVDWYYDGAQDNGTVCWGLEYKGVKAGEAVTGAGTTITKTSAGTHTTGQMVRTTFTTKILASNLEVCDTLALRLYRDVSADTLATDARLLNTHFHFTQNKLGKAT